MKKQLLAACIIVVSSSIPLGSALSVPIDNYDSFARDNLGNANQLNSISDLIENNGIHSIPTASSATNTTTQLEKQFRQYGHLSDTLKHAPDIIKNSPNNYLIRYLYSIALVVDGDTAKASSIIQNTPSDSKNKIYELLAKALIAKKQKKPKTAIKYIAQAQKTDPTHPYPYNLMGRIHQQNNQLDDALKNFKKATSQSTNFYIAHANTGVIQYMKGDLSESAASFQQAINAAPNYCPALIGHSIIAEELNNIDIAIQDLQKCKGDLKLSLIANKNLVALYLKTDQLNKAKELALGIRATDPDFANLNLGLIYLRQGQIQRATSTLKRINKESPEKSYLQAWGLFLSGDTDNAIALTNKITNADPNFIGAKIVNGLFKSYESGVLPKDYLSQLDKNTTSALFSSLLRGNEFASRGEYLAALNNWQKSDGFFRGFSSAGIKMKQLEKGVSAKEIKHTNIGILLYIQKFKTSAMLEFEKAIEINPNSILANYFTGLLYSDLGDHSKAAVYLSESLQTSPDFFSANYALAETYLFTGKQSKAIEHYDAARLAKNDVGVLVRLGLLYEARKSFKEAATIYKELTNNFPDIYIGFNQLAWLYAKQGINNNEALTLAKKAQALLPNNISILDTLGWVYANKKDYKNALTHLEKANKLSSGTNPDVLYHLAYVQNASGKKNAAEKNLKKALKLSKNFESLEQAKQLASNMGND